MFIHIFIIWLRIDPPTIGLSLIEINFYEPHFHQCHESYIPGYLPVDSHDLGIKQPIGKNRFPYIMMGNVKSIRSALSLVQTYWNTQKWRTTEVNFVCAIIFKNWKNNDWKEQLWCATVIEYIFNVCLEWGLGVENFINLDIWYSVKVNSVHLHFNVFLISIFWNPVALLY